MNIFPNAWGQHLILDLAGCPRDLLTSEDNLRRWVHELVDAIEMKAYGVPVIEHFATHSHDAAGFTLLQMIETSNICAHFAENLGQVYIDIFSCKNFDVEVAKKVCVDYFEPSHTEQHEIIRGAFPGMLEQAV